jgi:hypothetical protein
VVTVSSLSLIVALFAKRVQRGAPVPASSG